MAKTMTDLEHMKAIREADREWVADFRARYNIPAQRTNSEAPAPLDVYEAHSHHAEYAAARH